MKKNTSLLVKANRLMQKGDYLSAIEIYQLIKLTNEPTALEISNFNLGLIKQRIARLSLDFYLFTNSNFRQEVNLVEKYFDVGFYKSQFGESHNLILSPVLHYCSIGWKEKKDPNPNFSTSNYLEANPDVLINSINPFWHYLQHKNIDLMIFSTDTPLNDLVAEQEKTESYDNDLKLIEPHFDRKFYLRKYPDIVESGIDPLNHYFEQGWKEGRDPSFSFSTQYYLTANPDVAAVNINPLVHYHRAGITEGRLVQHPGGVRADILSNLIPLEETVKKWEKNLYPDRLLSSKEIHELLITKMLSKISGLMFSVGHDDYLSVAGGVQLCISREQKLALERNIVYFNIHPFQPLPRLVKFENVPQYIVTLIINGVKVGCALMESVIQTASIIKDHCANISIVIHHLMGHCPESIANLVEASGSSQCSLWLHDFFTICPSYALQRNNVNFCGGPLLQSNSCQICLYGDERVSHQSRMSTFFSRLRVNVLAPSDFTADFWVKHSHLSYASIRIIEHMAITWHKAHGNLPRLTDPITIAYIGYTALHKGWPLFQRVVRKLRKEQGSYRFIYFGVSSIDDEDIERVQVHVTVDSPQAMINSLREHNVDIFLQLTNCAETFSFSTFEAIAAGAYVFAKAASGNVAYIVAKTELGVIFDTEEDLIAHINSDYLQPLVKNIRDRNASYVADVRFSEMTFSII